MVEALEPYKNEIYPRLRQKAKEKKQAQINKLMKEVEELE
jgi:hemerythrin superfamily protein